MRRIYIAMCCLWAGISGVCAQDNTNKVRITLRQAIQIAQLQSVDAAVALNELRTAYWEFRTHRAENEQICTIIKREIQEETDRKSVV